VIAEAERGIRSLFPSRGLRTHEIGTVAMSLHDAALTPEERGISLESMLLENPVQFLLEREPAVVLFLL
jgi:hypothetical protein